jgi:hypothetical protein
MQTTLHQTPNLPAPIARFFAHETTDPRAVSRCFTENAVVRDEGNEYHGRAAIAAWNADALAKYGFTTVPLSAETSGDITAVSAKVSGNFPGSPVQLQFRFTVEGDLLARLEIAP